jgi:RNA polymerase sigma-70 factor (ECF subfamily)
MSEMALTSATAGTIECTDEALAAAARAGDREAYTRLMERYRRLALSYAHVRLGSAEEAEDAAQEAFVKAWQALDRYRGDCAWGGWFMAILRNHCLDVIRRDGARRFELLDVEWPDPGPSPDGALMASEDREEVARAIRTLPEKLATPLLMRYVMGRSNREVALALGMRESTVIGRVAAALRILRRRLGAGR